MSEFPKPPKIVYKRHSGYEVYLDSPTGYEFQGIFDSNAEAVAWIESQRQHPEDTPSLWH